jgi:acetyl esterase/lipase
MRELSSRLARMGGVRGLSAAYRLAPEHTFPAAVEDAVTAYRWLLEQGVAAGNVIVSGASAGGGLALALLLAAREQGLPLPAGAVVLSPWVDLTQSGETFATHAAADPVISKAYLDRFAGMYLGDADPMQPLASPVFGELAGLPPVLIQVGGAETMLDESRRFAAKARQAGVEVRLDEWPEMVHVWQACGMRVPEARDAIEQAGAWMRGRLGLPRR